MKAFNKKIIIYIVTFIICGIIAFFIYTFVSGDNNSNTSFDEQDEEPLSFPEERVFEDKLLGLEIGGELYVLELQNNEAAHDLLYMSPMTIEAEDNGVSKYSFLSSSISMNGDYADTASAGDLMIYNNNCLVLFTQFTILEEPYVLIGHINDLGELSSENVVFSFVR